MCVCFGRDTALCIDKWGMKTSAATTNTTQGPLKLLEGSPPPPPWQGRQMPCALAEIVEAKEQERP